MSTIKTTVIQPLASGGILSIKQGDGITDVLQIDGSGRLGIRMPSGAGFTNPMTINHDSTGTVMPGLASYGGIHLHQSSGNNGFVGITSKATSTGTQGGFLIEGGGGFGTKLHLMTTDSYTAGMKHRVVVDHLGKVGIGTLTPAVSLDVVGEARSSTSTIAGSNAKTLVTKDYVDGLNFSTGTYVVYALVTPLYGTAPTATSRGSFSPAFTTTTTRGSGVEYTSPVDSTVMVSVVCDRNSGLLVVVGGQEIMFFAAGNIAETVTFIVPPNKTYKVTASSGIGGWTELIS